jgi:hypothetical protein
MTDERINIKLGKEAGDALRARKGDVRPPTTWDGFVLCELLPAYDEMTGYSSEDDGSDD